ncbi:MAG: DUF4358 domain-containing protein [Oscillospiraceae bacterium]
MKTKVILAFTLALVLSVSAMAGCSKKPTEDVTSSAPPSSEAPKKAQSGQLTAIYEDMLKEVFGEEQQRFMLNEDAVQIKELTGMDVSSDAVKEYIYAMPMMNVQFQIFVGVEAAEGKVADVEAMLNSYKDKVLAEKEAFPYVDFGLEKARGAKVITVDNYVFYVCIANPEFNPDVELKQADIDAQIEETIKVIKESIKY